MKLNIYRKIETARSIIGELWIEGRTIKEGYTLEPSRNTPVHSGHPCVPAGIVYKVRLSKSPHLGYVTPELLDVPGRSEIRIHKGNKPEDSLGCTLMGLSVGPQPDWINKSAEEFEHLMHGLYEANFNGEEITAEYFDPQ